MCVDSFFWSFYCSGTAMRKLARIPQYQPVWINAISTWNNSNRLKLEQLSSRLSFSPSSAFCSLQYWKQHKGPGKSACVHVPFASHWTGEGHRLFCTMNPHARRSAFCPPQFQLETRLWLLESSHCERSPLHTFEDDSHHHSKWTLDRQWEYVPYNIPSKWQPISIYKPSNIKCIIKLHSYLEEIAVICCFWRTNTNLLKFEAVVGTDWRNWWRWPYTWALDSARKSSLIRVTIPHGHIPARIPVCKLKHTYVCS